MVDVSKNHGFVSSAITLTCTYVFGRYTRHSDSFNVIIDDGTCQEPDSTMVSSWSGGSYN